MLVRTRGGETELRSDSLFLDRARIPSWSEASGTGATWSGVPVTRETALGLPAAGAAVRLISETIGMIPMLVYEGDPVERERARESWQWQLLHDQPSPDGVSAFDFFQDVATSIEVDGNAYIWKQRRSARRVTELMVLEPRNVEVRRDDNDQKVFDVKIMKDAGRPGGGQTMTLTSADILHIRGWTLYPGADVGVSPIELHRNSLSSHESIHEFEGRFYRNNARPGGVIEVPGDVSRDRLDKAREVWEETHRGTQNMNRIGVLAFGARYRDVGFSLQDAQFVQSKQFSVEEIARMFRIDHSLLGEVTEGQRPQISEQFERFLKIDLASRLRRIEMALRNDPDLFPGRRLFPEFLTDAVLRPDILTRYEAYRLARQGGWLKPNEIRERENLPPADGGDEIQETPVGGAANAAPTTEE